MYFRLHGDSDGDPNGAGATLGQWYFPYGGSVTVEVQKWYKLSVSSIKENGKVRL